MRLITPGTPCVRCARLMCPRGQRIDGLLAYGSRGLCAGCRSSCLRNGTFRDYQPLTMRSRDIVEDYEFLAAEGYTRRQAAERMGINPKRLEKAIERTRQRIVAA